MSSKSMEFRNFLYSMHFQLYAIVETGFHSGVYNAEFFANDFVVFRCDRSPLNSSKLTRGGVLLAVYSSLRSERIFVPGCETIEFLCVKVFMCKKTYYFIVLYIPPRSSIDIYLNHIDCISEIVNMSHCNDTIVVLGDFNLPNIIWSVDSESLEILPSNVLSANDSAVLDALFSFNLKQINLYSNDNNSFLDLIFVNNTECLSVFESLTSFKNNDSDHNSLEIEFHVNNVNEKCREFSTGDLFYDFKACDSHGLSEFLRCICWNDLFHNNEIDINVKLFNDLLFVAFDRFVPLRRKRNYSYPPWFDSDLINLRNRKNKAYYRLRTNDCDYNKSIFVSLRDQFKSEFNTKYLLYIRMIEANIKQNPKLFWKFANDKRSTAGFPSIMNYNGIQLNTVSEICTSFASFFQSVYKDNSSLIVEEPCVSNCQFNIPFLSITEDDICNTLLDFNDGCGPDGIPSSILKCFASYIATPLCYIFNQSLVNSYFPTAWKLSHIVPIYKKGNRSDVCNYRGISILSSIPKLFELIVTKHLAFHTKEIISCFQHGFTSGKSTSTNLLQFTKFAVESLESQAAQVDSIYFDFAKAFDSIDHTIIIKKLSEIGFAPNFLKWIASYLVGRRQYVLLNQVKSDYIYCHSGVPQGSHLGPIIFLLFVNDIPNIFKFCNCLLFADDLKIFKRIQSLNDAELLQSEINSLSHWCSRNKLLININKCSVMSFYRTSKPVIFNYHLDGNELCRVTSIVDLGVLFDHKLTFGLHLDKIILKANSLLGFIFRMTKEFVDIFSCVSLYTSLVRSHLEYAVVVWYPQYEVYIKRLESIQKRFTVFIYRKLGYLSDRNKPMWRQVRDLPAYESRCQNLRIDTLVKRRKIASAMFVGDSLSGRIRCPNLISAWNIYVPGRSLRQREFLFIEFHRTNYGSNEPTVSMAKIFNDCYHLFDFEKSRECFRNAIRNYNF